MNAPSTALVALLAALPIGTRANPAGSAPAPHAISAIPSIPSIPAIQGGRGIVAVRAGTAHLVEEGRVIEDATVLVRNGRILAVGSDVDVPPAATVVDYGPDAVLLPGLVAAYSPYALGSPSERTAEPGVRAVDGFDFFGTYAGALSGGVTTAYVTPAEGRLIAGEGALVKLAGDDFERRVVNGSAAIHGAIDASARRTRGYWEPPIPATVDVGIGYQKPQLPKSTMGAIIALQELVAAAREGDRTTDYGPYVPDDLKERLEAKVPWRMAAVEAPEIRALLGFAAEGGFPLVIDKATEAGGLADEIAAAGAAVVFRVPFQTNQPARDHGKDRDDRWPRFDVPAALVEAGVRVAIAGSSPRDLLFTAALATRGGLDEATALRAITLTPAELFGGADRVGSLSPGKDADLCVLNGPPFDPGTTVVATWIDGESAWRTHETGATVIRAEALHVGDGTVLRPGELLIEDGEIAEVAERVSRPRGATVVRAEACMPGMIDAFGHLGLEGATKVPAIDYELETIVGPGDEVDRRVAIHGITTVILTPRKAAKSGAPVMAYKPASNDPERQVLSDLVALRLSWQADNRLESGEDVEELLERGQAYRQKWIEYETAMAAWTPPPPEPDKAEKKARDDEEEDDEAKEGDGEEEDDDDGKSKKRRGKKDEEKELEPDPVTGVWRAEVEREGEEAATVKLRLLFEAGKGSGDVQGNLRSDLLSDTLVEVEGYWNREEKRLGLRGLGSRGWVQLETEHDGEKLTGTVSTEGTSLEAAFERLSKEYVVAKRTERRAEKEEEEKEPKGKPKEPKVDSKLEPVKAVLEGRLALVVEVESKKEILDCVALCESYGVRPILFGAREVHEVADEIAGRVRGCLLSPAVLQFEPERGTDFVTQYSDLQSAGIPVAFHSGAEEGAIDLPIMASYAIQNGMSPTGAVRALTSDAAEMMFVSDRVGRLARGLDADVLALDGPPLSPGTSVVRVWVDGEEVTR